MRCVDLHYFKLLNLFLALFFFRVSLELAKHPLVAFSLCCLSRPLRKRKNRSKGANWHCVRTTLSNSPAFHGPFGDLYVKLNGGLQQKSRNVLFFCIRLNWGQLCA
ncbi:hypothetical protein EDD85DRAFT_508298 [Armillaria nabsnona]|nr:hypothetical protein EDD85DRAFT_508298 [Armillaria nabsnona]